MARYYNISGVLTQSLLAPGDSVDVTSVSLVNTHASTTCSVDLYIEKKLTGKFYYEKSLALAVGTSVTLKDISFSNRIGEFGFFIKLGKPAVFTLTGTIDPAASVTVPGVNTLFLSEIAIGDEIIVAGETRTVTAIASNTSLTVSAAFSNNSNDTTPDCSPKPNVDVIIN